MNQKIIRNIMGISLYLFFSNTLFAETEYQHLPMYGGQDRTQDESLIEEDKAFIADATRTFSTKELAAEGYVERGFDLYSQNKLDRSMWRFNQAWLLDKNNYYVYLGFGLLLNKKEHPCQATRMFKLANEKGLKENGFLADYAYTSTECALIKEEDERQQLFVLSNTLHEQATQTVNEPLRAYVYHSWGKSYFLQRNYEAARSMLEKSKQLGGSIDSSLARSLEKKITNKD